MREIKEIRTQSPIEQKGEENALAFSNNWNLKATCLICKKQFVNISALCRRECRFHPGFYDPFLTDYVVNLDKSLSMKHYEGYTCCKGKKNSRGCTRCDHNHLTDNPTLEDSILLNDDMIRLIQTPIFGDIPNDVIRVSNEKAYLLRFDYKDDDL